MTTSVREKIRGRRAYFPTSALAKKVETDTEMLTVHLVDGRVISAPLAWFPALRDATPAERANCEIGGGGISLHWPDLDEDLSVVGLLAGGDLRSA